MFGFLQKHHNSQLQKETSATAVSVVLNALWTSQTFKSSSSKRDIRSNLNYKLWSVHSQTFHIENSSSTDDTRWNQNCATWLISQRYIWYGSRNKGKTIHTTRPYQRVSEATKAPCGKVENEAARFALIKGIEPQPYHASWCEPFTPLRCHTPPSAGWKELQASPSLWTVLQSWRCWMCSVV